MNQRPHTACPVSELPVRITTYYVFIWGFAHRMYGECECVTWHRRADDEDVVLYMHIILRATTAARRTTQCVQTAYYSEKNIYTMRRFYCGIYLSVNRKWPHQIRNWGAGRKRRTLFILIFHFFKVIKKIYEYETIM